MATITLKGIDDHLLNDLKKIAKKNRRSLNQEIIYQLEQLIPFKPLSFEEMMALRNKNMPKMRGVLTEEQLNEAKERERQ